MYTVRNFKTKKALKQAVLAGEVVEVYQPGPFASDVPKTGRVSLEGPHYPEPHKWYATADVVNGRVVMVS